MLVGIHKDPYGTFSAFSKRYENILNYNRIHHIRIDASHKNFWDQVANLDLFVYRWIQTDNHRQIAKTIIPIIEKELGIKCLPNMATCWHYDDKIRQYYLLRQNGFPIIKSWIFWDKKQALHWIETANFPIVFKLKGGAGSNNVILARTKRKGKKLINRMFGRGIKSGHIPDFGDKRYKDFSVYRTIHRWGGNVLRKLRDEDISPYWQVHKNYALFQRYLPNNDYDTRVAVIGKRAFVFIRYNRDNDFRASGSGKIDYDTSKIDMRCLEIAFEISSVSLLNLCAQKWVIS